MEFDKDDIRTEFTCDDCKKTFSSRKARAIHISKANCCKEKVGNICEGCGLSFYRRGNLKRHREKSCGHILSGKVANCAICSFTAQKNILKSHYQIEHGLQLCHDVIDFNNENEFYSWKRAVEQNSAIKYVRLRGVWFSSNNTKMAFVCHKNGVFASKSTGKRKMKKNGSKKINAFCPSRIDVTRTLNGTCSVNFLSTHVGHIVEKKFNSFTKKDAKIVSSDTIIHATHDRIEKTGSETALSNSLVVDANSTNAGSIDCCKKTDAEQNNVEIVRNASDENFQEEKSVFTQWVCTTMTDLLENKSQLLVARKCIESLIPTLIAGRSTSTDLI